MSTLFPQLTDDYREKALNVPTGKIRLVIDTDAKNEVDDQFAIAWALRSKDRFNVEAVYAAPYSHDCFKTLFGGPLGSAAGIEYTEKPGVGMEASYQEILKLFSLLDEKPENRVFRGSEAYIKDTGRAVESEAARDLIRRALSGDEPLYVAAIEAPTNIASAIMMEPEIIRKIVVVWLGGQPVHFGHGVEFNLIQDIAASRILLDSGVPLVLVPCMNVASMLTITAPELEQKMKEKNKISDYLADIVLNAFSSPEASAFALMMPAMMRHIYLAKREDRSEEYLAHFPSEHNAWSRIIWDISTISFLKNPNWTPSVLDNSPVLKDDFSWGSNPSRHKIRIVNFCWRDLIFGDMISCLTGAEG